MVVGIRAIRQGILCRIKNGRAIQGAKPWYVGVAQVDGHICVWTTEICGREILAAKVMATGDRKFVVNEHGRKVMPGAGYKTEDLLVRAPNVMAVTDGTCAIEVNLRA